MKTMILATLLTSSLAHAPHTHASLVLNEIDYDQVGSDTAEVIELYNNGATAISLDGFTLDLINGSSGSAYRSIDLSGFSIDIDSYFVVCNDTTLVMNCDNAFTTSAGWIQNGAPDAVALYDNSKLIDSFSYEGFLPGFTEGDAMTIKDSTTVTLSLARILNGIDTDDNLADFQTGCLTPGTANIAGTGNCSAMAVSAVPVPAAVWLFASGLLGLVQVGRRRVS
jgi:predicted extracellular nuclease